MGTTFEEAIAQGRRWVFGREVEDDVFSVPEVIPRDLKLHWRNSAQMDSPRGWTIRDSTKHIVGCAYQLEVEQERDPKFYSKSVYLIVDAATNETVAILELKQEEDGLDGETLGQFYIRCVRTLRAACEFHFRQLWGDISIWPGMSFVADEPQSGDHLDFGLAYVGHGSLADEIHPGKLWNDYAKEKGRGWIQQ